MKTLTLLLALVATTMAHARIGESPSQCDTRYGPPVAVTPKKWITKPPVGGMCLSMQSQFREYLKDGFHLSVKFEAGKAVGIAYTRMDKKEISGGQLQALMHANTGTTFWSRANVDLGWVGYEAKEKGILAAMDLSRPDQLLVALSTDVKKHNERQLEAEAASVAGL